MAAQGGGIWQQRPARNGLELAACYNLDVDSLRLPACEPVAHTAWQSGQPIIALASLDTATAGQTSHDTCIAMPIIHDGKPLGTLLLVTPAARAFSAHTIPPLHCTLVPATT